MRHTKRPSLLRFSNLLSLSVAALMLAGQARAAAPGRHGKVSRAQKSPKVVGNERGEQAEPTESAARAELAQEKAEREDQDEKGADDQADKRDQQDRADQEQNANADRADNADKPRKHLKAALAENDDKEESAPPPPSPAAEELPPEPPHKLEFYGLLVPAVEITSSFGANAIGMTPDMNASSVRGGSFSGPYTTTPANQQARARTISAPSHVGIRGRWDFAEHHYGRFQWEVGSLTFGGTTPVTMYSPGLGLVSRNSAAFLGGPWGEVGFGIWDTPFSLMGNYAPAYAPLINASTLMSSSLMGGMPFANGAVPGFPAQNFCITETDSRNILSFTPAIASDLTQCANNAMNFDRRAANSIIYQSPTMAGLALRTQFEVNFRRSSDFEVPPRNPWASSTSVSFTGAGLFAAVGFETRQDFVADAVQLARMLTLGGNGTTQAQWSGGGSGITASREQGVRLNLRYTAPFGLTLGVLVEQLDYYSKYAMLSAGDITALRKQAGRLELIYHRGRHTIGGAYHRALPLKGQVAAPNVLQVDGSGGMGVTAGYSYQLAKGLSVGAYFMTIVNEVNARYNVVFQGLPSPAGADLRAFGTGMRYAF